MEKGGTTIQEAAVLKHDVNLESSELMCKNIIKYSGASGMYLNNQV